MKKITFMILLSSFCLFFVTGCSTIVHGTKQNVRVTTNAKDAVVTVDGLQKEAPATFILEGKSSGYNVAANKQGYKTGYAHINSSFRVLPTIFGNILWLIPGLIVDFATGAAYELPSDVNVHMEKKCQTK
jgi:hypothetical protein